MLILAAIVFIIIISIVLIFKYPEIKWFILVLSLPLEVVSYYKGMSIKLWMLVFAILLLMWTIELLIGNKKILNTNLNILMLLLVGVNIVSVLNAVDPGRTIRMNIQYALLYVLAFGIVNNVESKERIYAIIKYMYISCAAVAMFGLVQFAGAINGQDVKLPIEYYSLYNPDVAMFLTNWWVDIGGVIVPRIRSTFSDPNLFGGYINSILPLMVSVLVQRILSKEKYNMLFVATIVVFVAGIAAFSRSIIGGMLLGALILGFYWARETLNKRIWKVVPVFAVLAIGVFVAMPGNIRSRLSPDIIVKRMLQTTEAHDESTKRHVELAGVAMAMWERYPILGVGLGNFGVQSGGSRAAMSHSAIISFFAETGMIGGVINISLIMFVAYSLIRSIGMVEKYSRWFAIDVGLLASYAATIFGNITYHYYNQAYLWFLVGFALAVARYSKLHNTGIVRTGSTEMSR
jgi:hypothetical protein